MIVDLTHNIEVGMPVYPDTAPPEVKALDLYEEFGVYLQEYQLNGHIGTHLDVPAHLFGEGDSTASMDISTFFGTAQVLNARDYVEEQLIGKAILDQLQGSEMPDFLLFATGWSKKWGSSDYFRDFPVISEDLMRVLAESNIKGVGVDTISVDSVMTSELLNHKIILGSNKIIVENLTNLESLIGIHFQFSCLPLKFSGGDGSPIRAIGIINQDN